MQVGGKEDETGWGVYEEARKGGAVIATAHEHSYSRTHLLSSMMNQTVASTSNTLTLTKGNSFAFVSGLGGHSVRAQLLSGAWWAGISAATCLAGDPICQPNGTFGALFAVFNVDGQPNKAFFYFKDISGRIVDSFTVISNVELPTVTGLLPDNTESGSGSFTLPVNAANFGSNSIVRWNNVDRPTSLISSTQLLASISSADITAAGMALVTVSGPGGTSNSATFAIKAPQVITALQPSSVEAGGGAFSLTVNGTNFEPNSIVRWNNVDQLTTVVSSTQLTAAISFAEIAAPGTALVTVSRPGNTSNGATFRITQPRPIITALQPASVEAGNSAFSLTVNGDNFLDGSIVRWNGADRPTTFIHAKQLTAAISLSDIASTGAVSVTVANPDGISNAATFTIAPPSLILFTEPNSERAIALDSVILVRDPFLISTTTNLSSDRRTRIMIFSPNLSLMPADSFSTVSAQAEDRQHNIYPLTVEFIGKIPQYDWLAQIVVRLPDKLGSVDALWVSIGYRGAVSNKALISLK